MWLSDTGDDTPPRWGCRSQLCLLGPRKTQDQAAGSIGVKNNGYTENGFPGSPGSVPEKQGVKDEFCGLVLRVMELVL